MAIPSIPRTNAAVTNALHRGEPADVLDDLKRDRVLARLAHHARKFMADDGVTLDDARVAALADLLTGRGGQRD